MEKIVCSMPAKPKQNIGLPLKIGPTLTDFLGDALGYKKVLTINSLNTYKNSNAFLKTYLQQLQNDEIEYHLLYNDRDYLNEIIEKIYQMLYYKVIVEDVEDVIRCECGKVDILKKAISDHYDGQIYKKENDQIICKDCKSVCKETKEKILKVNIDRGMIRPISVTPVYLNRVVNGIIETMSGNCLVISKRRDTGCYIYYNNTKYNIDIDFVWLLLLQIIPADKKIYIAGNRQIIKMFNLNYINGLTDKQNISFVANPYFILSDNELQKCNLDEDEDKLIQKITILCNMKWRKNDNIFNSSVYKYVKSLSNQQRKELYEQMLMPFKMNNNDISLEEFLESSLIQSSNIQKNMKRIKTKKV